MSKKRRKQSFGGKPSVKEVKQKKSLRLEIVEKMSTLATAGFGLVAALAWNEAIQDLFKIAFPDKDSLTAKFVYAMFITVLIVLITWWFGRATKKLKDAISGEKQ